MSAPDLNSPDLNPSDLISYYPVCTGGIWSPRDTPYATCKHKRLLCVVCVTKAGGQVDSAFVLMVCLVSATIVVTLVTRVQTV